MQNETLARVLFICTMEHILLDGQKLYAAKDVAEYFKIDNSALNAWLRIHDDFRNNSEYVVEMGGGKRPRRFFTELGITVYANVKDGTRNNQHKTKGEVSTLYVQSKTKIAEAAFFAKHQKSGFASDPIIAMRITQLEQEERLNRLEHLEEKRAIEAIESEKLLLSLPEPTKQAPKRTVRSLVVECVTLHAKSNGIPHNIVWSKLYKEYSIRTKINLSIRAKASKLSVLEYVEQNEDIEILYAIAKEIL